MDVLINNEVLSNWLIHYGSIVLFVLLVLGIIILPVPEETLMILAGTLMSNGHLNIPFTIIAAFAGSICGITLSYLIGRTAGHYLIVKYGGRIGITSEHLDYAHNWFERFGKWTLMIGYFIPGVRHMTGLVSGMSYMEYKHFALFAYVGAILWVSVFLSIGYFSGNYVFSLISNIELDVDTKVEILIVLLIVLYIAYALFKSYVMKSK